MPPTRRSFVRQLWPALLAFALDATEFALPEGISSLPPSPCGLACRSSAAMSTSTQSKLSSATD